MKISGFTIVRNAEKLGYPLRESILSILPICDEVIINCGDSTDSTLAICRNLENEYPGKIMVFESLWKTNDQSGGNQLKYQTDQALARCSGDWCVYIQADEVLHESSHQSLLASMQLANKDQKVDGLLFTYRHFYISYDWEVRGRQWYRQEIRAFKNHRNIESFRDAQGFRKEGTKLLVQPANAEIFHYGYVRNITEMKTKSQEMAKWWGKIPTLSDKANSPRRHVGLRKFTGKHPAVMAETIGQYQGVFDPTQHPRVWNLTEFKSALALAWEKIFHYRIGEYKNYELTQQQS